jgi:hypothetical protein
MSTERCLDDAELDAARSLSPDHPHSRHLEACPRCFARLEAYRAFLAGEAVEGARVVEAREDVRAALRRGMGLPDAPGGEPRVIPMPRPARPRYDLGRVMAVAAAVLAVSALAVFVAPRVFAPADAPTLRGVQQGEGAAELELLEPERLASGLVLRWRPVEGAVGYKVLFLRADLSELADIGPLTEPQLKLSPEALPPGLTNGERVRWQVVALRDGERVVTSTVAVVTVP